MPGGDGSATPFRSRRARAITVIVGFEAALGLAGLGLGWLLGEAPLRGLVFDRRSTLVGLAATGPLLVVFWLMVRFPVGPFGRIADLLDEILVPYLKPCTVLDLAVISLAAGIGEELLFRGALQADFVGRWGPGAGIALAGVVFGLAHCITPTYAVLATLIGVYLGLVFQITGSLTAVVLVHGLYDFGALVYLLRWPGKRQRDEAST